MAESLSDYEATVLRICTGNRTIPNPPAGGPALLQAIDALMARGLLTASLSGYAVTDAGRAYVRKITVGE